MYSSGTLGNGHSVYMYVDRQVSQYLTYFGRLSLAASQYHIVQSSLVQWGLAMTSGGAWDHRELQRICLSTKSRVGRALVSLQISSVYLGIPRCVATPSDWRQRCYNVMRVRIRPLLGAHLQATAPNMQSPPTSSQPNPLHPHLRVACCRVRNRDHAIYPVYLGLGI